MARPKIEIDGSLVLKFAQIGCKNKEIADHFRVSTDTIERRFAAELAKGSSDMKMSLRQMQLKSARNGNVTMQIWLGKQMLGQRDNLDQQLSGDKEAPIKFEGSIIDLINAARTKA